MQRYRIVENGYPYFLTSSIVKWLPVFVTPSVCDIVIDSLRFCREQKGLRIHAYVIMPTHIHLIVSTQNDLSAVLRDFKKYTSKRIVAAFTEAQSSPFESIFKFCGQDSRPPTSHRVWQEGNHPEQIQTQSFFQTKADYIHANPYRKGLIVDPMAWTYSSIRYYYGTDAGPLEVDWLEW